MTTSETICPDCCCGPDDTHPTSCPRRPVSVIATFLPRSQVMFAVVARKAGRRTVRGWYSTPAASWRAALAFRRAGYVVSTR